MKRSPLIYLLVLACVISAFVLGGCMSIANSPTPKFYMLQSVNQAEVKQKFNISSNVFIGLGPVKVPEYQNRPQIVIQNEDKTIAFTQFDRWGAPLDLALASVIAENLAVMLPGATVETCPCNYAIPLKYQVIIDVVQLEIRLDKDMFFVAQWSIIDLENKKMLLTKRSEFRQPVEPHNYSGLAKTLSAACLSLSSEIAENLALTANQHATSSIR